MFSDLRLAYRQLAKSPGFTVIAVLTLALGIGVNTTMFSVLNGTLLKPPPYPGADELVRVYRTSPQSQAWPHAAANIRDYREKFASLQNLAAFTWRNYNLALPDQPAERLRSVVASGNFFELLGRPAHLGRTFQPADDAPGHGDVLVLSFETWQARFGADPAVVNRTIRLDGEPVTIIGVMPEGFNDTLLWGKVDGWRPLALTDEQATNRNANYLQLIARLAPGSDFARARAEAAAIAAQTAADHPETNANNGLRLEPLAESRMDSAGRRMSWLNLGLATFVLAIACANLANLQLARSARHGRQYAIMAALGASRRRLFAQSLAEALLLALAGGALGVLLAAWGTEALSRVIVVAERGGWDMELDGRVLAFSALISLAAGVFFGVFPGIAAAARHGGLNAALKQGGRGTTSGRWQRRMRHMLMIAQFALALVLLAGGALFLRGLHAFISRDPGWDVDRLLTARVSLPAAGYASPEAQVNFYTQLEERLRVLPGVERVGLSSSLPIWSFSTGQSFGIEGRPPPVAGQEPITFMTAVSPDFFDTARVQLLRGRGLAPTDTATAPRVVVINQALADALWPDTDPIGQRIGDEDEADPQWTEIVGIVQDIEPLANLAGPFTRYQMYVPLAQAPARDMIVTLRTALPPATLTPAVQGAAAQIDRTVPVYDFATAQELADRVLTNFSIGGWLLAGFAVLGLLLASLGLYGIVSGNVTQRTGEIGVRMALGAQARDIGRLIIGGGARLALGGTLIGLAGAYAIARVLAHAVPEIPAQDPFIVAGVTLLLLVVALLACWLPARRAMRISPVEALRAE